MIWTRPSAATPEGIAAKQAAAAQAAANLAATQAAGNRAIAAAADDDEDEDDEDEDGEETAETTDETEDGEEEGDGATDRKADDDDDDEEDQFVAWRRWKQALLPRVLEQLETDCRRPTRSCTGRRKSGCFCCNPAEEVKGAQETRYGRSSRPR